MLLALMKWAMHSCLTFGNDETTVACISIGYISVIVSDACYSAETCKALLNIPHCEICNVMQLNDS